MGKNLIDESKAWLPYFYKAGVWETNPKVKFNGKPLSEAVTQFVGDYLQFLIESNFLNNCTKVWLTSNLTSVNKAFEFYNSQADEIDKINLHTAQSKITYDKRKLERYFNSDMLLNVMAYPEKYLKTFRKQLSLLTLEFFDDKEYRGAIGIKVPKSFLENSLSDTDFDTLESTLLTFSKKMMAEVEKGKTNMLTPDMIGYYNYLISNKQLNDEEKARLKRIRKALGLDE